ncbi:hypothetical protein ACFFX0_08915 [Citricoccus parietis]|uniref:Uncharacterized protein n=1 Tax=Citricoccus parietis TaxID=592307 RepID=A0ABV5FXB2_9MICC
MQAAQVVPQLVAALHEGGVEPAGCRFLGPLHAQQGLDELTAHQLGGGRSRDVQRQRVHVHGAQTAPEVVQGGGALGHHQHALAVPGELRHGIGRGLRLARTGRGEDHQVVAGGDVVEGLLLGRVRVQDQVLSGRVPLVDGR